MLLYSAFLEDSKKSRFIGPFCAYKIFSILYLYTSINVHVLLLFYIPILYPRTVMLTNILSHYRTTQLELDEHVGKSTFKISFDPCQISFLA